jgi:hypothetical protein
MILDADDLQDPTDQQLRQLLRSMRGLSRRQLRSVIIDCFVESTPQVRTALFVSLDRIRRGRSDWRLKETRCV